ncbi:hypothetical protein ACLKA7_011572, partial [Drosophila subpalustris]
TTSSHSVEQLEDCRNHEIRSFLLLLGVLLATTLLNDTQKTKNKLKSKNKVKTTVAPQVERLVLQKAERCSATKCKLPDCRCSDATLPRPKFKGKEQEIPQVRTWITINTSDVKTH